MPPAVPWRPGPSDGTEENKGIVGVSVVGTPTALMVLMPLLGTPTEVAVLPLLILLTEVFPEVLSISPIPGMLTVTGDCRKGETDRLGICAATGAVAQLPAAPPVPTPIPRAEEKPELGNVHVDGIGAGGIDVVPIGSCVVVVIG